MGSGILFDHKTSCLLSCGLFEQRRLRKINGRFFSSFLLPLWRDGVTYVAFHCDFSLLIVFYIDCSTCAQSPRSQLLEWIFCFPFSLIWGMGKSGKVTYVLLIESLLAEHQETTQDYVNYVINILSISIIFVYQCFFLFTSPLSPGLLSLSYRYPHIILTFFIENII